MTITYDFWNINNGDVIIQPAGNTSFDAGCFQLLSTSVISSQVTGISVGASVLYYTNTNTPGTNNLLGVSYNLLYQCSGTSTTARPFASQKSGVQHKYTGNYLTQITNTFPAGSVPFTLTKSVHPTSLAESGGTVTYTVRITNTSAFESQFNGITDTMPVSVTYGNMTASSQISTSNSSRVPTSGSGGTLRWDGQPQRYYTLAASSSITLAYTATIPGIVGTYRNTATANSGLSTFGNSFATVQVFAPTAVTLSRFSAYSEPDGLLSFWLGGMVIALGVYLAWSYFRPPNAK